MTDRASIPKPPPDRFRRCVIADDRGRTAEMIDPFRLYALGGDGVIDRDHLRAIIEDVAPSRLRMLRYLAWFAGIYIVAMVLAVFVPRYLENGSVLHSAGIAARSLAVWWAFAYLLLILPWQLLVERRAKRRRIAALVLSHGHCAHCGYELRGLAPDPADGATVCPECSGAWKLDDAGRALASGDGPKADRHEWRCYARLGLGIALIAVGLVVLHELAHRFLGW
jgi:hypothetical protein